MKNVMQEMLPHYSPTANPQRATGFASDASNSQDPTVEGDETWFAGVARKDASVYKVQYLKNTAELLLNAE